MKKKPKLKKWVKVSLVLIDSIILFYLLYKYGYIAGINYFGTFLILVMWFQLGVVNPVLLFCIDENLI